MWALFRFCAGKKNHLYSILKGTQFRRFYFDLKNGLIFVRTGIPCPNHQHHHSLDFIIAVDEKSIPEMLRTLNEPPILNENGIIGFYNDLPGPYYGSLSDRWEPTGFGRIPDSCLKIDFEEIPTDNGQ